MKRLLLVISISLCYLFTRFFTSGMVHAQSAIHLNAPTKATHLLITTGDCHLLANSFEVKNADGSFVSASIHDATLQATFTVSLWYCPALQSNYAHAQFQLDNPDPNDERTVNTVVEVNRSDGASASATKTLLTNADFHDGSQDSPLIFAPVLAAQACVFFGSGQICTNFR